MKYFLYPGTGSQSMAVVLAQSVWSAERPLQIAILHNLWHLLNSSRSFVGSLHVLRHAQWLILVIIYNIFFYVWVTTSEHWILTNVIILFLQTNQFVDETD